MRSLSSTFTLSLPSAREILLTRQFRAPQKLVFEVMSQPEHLAQWWGPRSMKLVHCEMNFQVGGRYRYKLQAQNGDEYGFRGEYLEIRPTDRVVSTFEFEGLPGHGSIETMTLTENGELTTLQVLCLYKSQMDRDGHLNSGMETGARESHDRLEELIDSIVMQQV